MTSKGTLEQGLTLVELLVAMVLLGVLATAILAPLTGLFRMTAESTRTLGATAQAQEVIEHVQAQWRAYPSARDPQNPTPQEVRSAAAHRASRSRYARNCVENLPDPSEGFEVKVSVWALDADAKTLEALPLTCGGSAYSARALNPPPLKRVTVSVMAADPSNADPSRATSLTVDVPRP